VISLIHFENDFLFKKWGIQSIYMNNFVTFEYEKVIQSDLSSNNILMIGRGNDKYKRFDLGIKAMKYIIKKINDSQMIILSDNTEIDELKSLIKTEKLDNNIKFVGYSTNPEIYFNNVSLHIFPSIAEAFPMVLSETKIYGIPSILVGIDYVTAIKEGVIIVYDEKPETIANYAIKILNNFEYRKKIGKRARKSMKKFNNKILFKKWIKLIEAVNEGEDSFGQLANEDKPIPDNESIYILQNQINLLKKREKWFKNITINDLLDFSFIKQLNNFNVNI
jgi:glycosyltransferase involved in cell wall biosynthesis